MSARKFDIAVWGATGYTGNLICKYLLDHAPKSLTWAIAGRDSTKLDDLKNELHLPASVGTLLATENADKEFDEMCRQVKVFIGCAGPFLLCGKPLVAACVRNSTHYVDINGEAPFVRWMIENYEEEAKQRQILLVPCCGFDSTPSDLGNFLLHEHARSSGTTLNSVEGYFHLVGGLSGGTIRTLCESAAQSTCKDRSRYAYNPPNAERPSIHNHYTLGYSEELKRYIAPFIMAPINQPLVRRSNATSKDANVRRATYVECSFGYLSTCIINFCLFWLLSIVLMIPPLRFLLNKLSGKVGCGPSEKSRKEGHFVAKFIGRAADGKTFLCRLASTKDCYTVTAQFIVEAAIAIANHQHDLPGVAGGVLTPSTAFGNILVRRLKNSGMEVMVQ